MHWDGIDIFHCIGVVEIWQQYSNTMYCKYGIIIYKTQVFCVLNNI